MPEPPATPCDASEAALDFHDTPEEAAFRKEAAGWVSDRLTGVPHDAPADHDEKVTNARWWQEQLWLRRHRRQKY